MFVKFARIMDNITVKTFYCHSHSINYIFGIVKKYCPWVFHTVLTECFLPDLQHWLNDAGDKQEVSKTALQASSNWSRWKSVQSESSRAERPCLENTISSREYVAAHTNSVGAIQLLSVVVIVDHAPSSVLNMMSAHTGHVTHNRDAMIVRFFHSLPPTTVVVDKALSHCGKLWLVSIPHTTSTVHIMYFSFSNLSTFWECKSWPLSLFPNVFFSYMIIIHSIIFFRVACTSGDACQNLRLSLRVIEVQTRKGGCCGHNEWWGCEELRFCPTKT